MCLIKNRFVYTCTCDDRSFAARHKIGLVYQTDEYGPFLWICQNGWIMDWVSRYHILGSFYYTLHWLYKSCSVVHHLQSSEMMCESPLVTLVPWMAVFWGDSHSILIVELQECYCIIFWHTLQVVDGNILLRVSLVIISFLKFGVCFYITGLCVAEQLLQYRAGLWTSSRLHQLR